METTKYVLKDLLTIKNGKDHKALADGPYPVFGTGGVMRYAEKYLYDKVSILLPRKGTLTNIQYVDQPFWTVDTIYYTVVNEKLADPYYLFCYVNSLDLSGYDSGASIPSMTQKAYNKIKINLPDKETQKTLGEAIKAYDDLIENNNKRIAILEQMAENLYKEWFVRFRFPGYETAKFENGIPVGWEIKKIGDIARVKSGYAFKSEWWTDEGVPVIKIKDIQNNTIDFSDLSRVSEENTTNAKQFFVVEGDLLIAMTGATIGKLALVPDFNERLVVNQRVGKFFCGETPINSVAFLYYTLQQNWVQELIAMISGSNAAQPNISPFDIEKIKVLYNEEIVKQFNEKASKILEQILLLRKTNQNINKQRDLLLPRLMSGKLEV